MPRILPIIGVLFSFYQGREVRWYYPKVKDKLVFVPSVGADTMWQCSDNKLQLLLAQRKLSEHLRFAKREFDLSSLQKCYSECLHYKHKTRFYGARKELFKFRSPVRVRQEDHSSLSEICKVLNPDGKERYKHCGEIREK